MRIAEFGENPGPLKAYEGKKITHDDVVNMSKEVAKLNDVTALAGLLNKMNAAIRMYSGIEENKFSLMQYGKIRWKAQPPSKPVPLALKQQV